VFFEKIRIRNGELKTDFREDMEEIYDGFDMNGTWAGGNGKPGMDVKKRPDHTFYIPVDRSKEPYENEYGQFVML
jgi:hypothetical protein